MTQSSMHNRSDTGRGCHCTQSRVRICKATFFLVLFTVHAIATTMLIGIRRSLLNRFESTQIVQVIEKPQHYDLTTAAFLSEITAVTSSTHKQRTTTTTKLTVSVDFAPTDVYLSPNTSMAPEIDLEDHVVATPPQKVAAAASKYVDIRDYIEQRFATSTDTPLIIRNRNNLITNLEFAYASVEEMQNRSIRFPSVEHRVKVYMSNWYIPPCDDSARITYQYSTVTSDNDTVTVRELSLQQQQMGTEGNFGNDDVTTTMYPNQKQRLFEVDSHFDIKHDKSFNELHFVNRQVFMDCKHTYCRDVVNAILPAFDRLLENNTGKVVNDKVTTNALIFVQFGDTIQTRGLEKQLQQKNSKLVFYPRIPVIQKVRVSKSAIELNYETDDATYRCYTKGERRVSLTSKGYFPSHPLNRKQMEPIVWKLKTNRHYGRIYRVVAADTLKWEEKKDKAIFRGALTGTYMNGVRQVDALSYSVDERCRLLQRCWFTYKHGLSPLIDSKLTEPYFENRKIPRFLNVSNGTISTEIDTWGDRMIMDELLQYKALILLEGNDISSGLKWALFSKSIVMMPEPTLTSWAMEEKLLPWVHYVPINVYQEGNGTARTDAEEKMQWIMNNEEKARQIVKASTLWIADLVLHPDVSDDEMKIFNEMARRYISHFI
jgi:Glycosyl transferase family 90